MRRKIRIRTGPCLAAAVCSAGDPKAFEQVRQALALRGKTVPADAMTLEVLLALVLQD